MAHCRLSGSGIECEIGLILRECRSSAYFCRPNGSLLGANGVAPMDHVERGSTNVAENGLGSGHYEPDERWPYSTVEVRS